MEEQIKQNNTEKEIDLIETITILWRAKKFIAIVTGMSLLIGILYILFVTPLYRSTITLYPAIDTGSNSPMTAMARQLGVRGAQSGILRLNISDIAKSRVLSEKIISQRWNIEGLEKKITLMEYFDKIRNIEKPSDVVTKEDEKKWNKRRFYSYSSYFARERISTKEDVNTGLVKVNVDMENPYLSRDIANYVSLFIAQWVNDSQTGKIKQNLEFINERLIILYDELQQTENGLKKFRETNRNILNSPDLQLELQRLKRQVTIKQEVYLSLIKQKEINQIEENKIVDVIKILDNAIEINNPVKPRKKLVLAISLLLGLILSFVFLMTLHILSDRLKKYKIIKKLLNN